MIHLYIKCFVSQSVCLSVCHVLFVRRGTNKLFVPRGQTFLTHRRGRGETFLTHKREGEQTFLHRGGRQTFFVGSSGAYDDVDEEMVVSEATKLSAGVRIFRGL